MRLRRKPQQEADLDITSFMNLMIILVPVLLMSMVFAHVTVLDLKLPDLSADKQPNKDPSKETLELVIEPNQILINYPAGVLLKSVPKVPDDEAGENLHDFAMLSTVLQEVKRQLQNKSIEKKDILILSQPDTDYQTIVRVMDTARSFKAVVAASVVDAELFPQISLGDAPSPRAASRRGAQP